MEPDYVTELKDNGLVIVQDSINQLENLRAENIASFVIGVTKVREAIPSSTNSFEKHAIVRKDPEITTNFARPKKVVVGSS